MKINDYISLIFRGKVSLEKCYIHSSYANQHGLESNEKLEFLGDSVLNFIVTKTIVKQNRPEGELSKLRAKMVSTTSFAVVADELGLTENLKIISPISPKIKANLYEACVAEIYLQCGIEKTEEFVKLTLLKNKFYDDDYKTKLQEVLQRAEHNISYETISYEGVFKARVYNLNKLLGTGEGKTKKEAEQNAAKEALLTLEKR